MSEYCCRLDEVSYKVMGGDQNHFAEFLVGWIVTFLTPVSEWWIVDCGDVYR